jgi:hypothetical protein
MTTLPIVVTAVKGIPRYFYLNPLILTFSLWRRNNMRTYWDWYNSYKKLTAAFYATFKKLTTLQVSFRFALDPGAESSRPRTRLATFVS